MQNPNSPATPPTGLLSRLPTGLTGAVFWLGLWFCVLYVRLWIPGGFGTFLGVTQIFVGIALVAVAIPFLLRFVRQRMLWSLRNKLTLTYLLIGLAPVLLGLILASVLAYVAAGQFAIHLVDSRFLAELSQMSSENERRAELAAQSLQRKLAGVAEPNETVDAERSINLDMPRQKLRRDTQAFLNGAPVATGSKSSTSGVRAKTPWGLPPWAIELPGGHFSSLVLDGNDLYLVAIHQQRWNDGRLFTFVSSTPVDNQVLGLVAEGLGLTRLLPESTSNDDRSRQRPTRVQSQPVTGGAESASAKPNTSAPQGISASTAPKAADVTPSPEATAEGSRITGGIEPTSVNLLDIPVRFASTEPVTMWDSGRPDNILVDIKSRPSLLLHQLFGASIAGVVTDVLRISLLILFLLFAIIELFALWAALRLSRTITKSVADLYSATQHIDRGDFNYRIGVTSEDQLAELSRSFNTMTGSLQRLLREQKEKERLQNELSIAQEVQANLFPLHAKGIAQLDLHGVCRPARSVSGDYYDFLVFHENAHNGTSSRTETGVGIALGDISGKGISAALLMATLHSAVRAYRFASEELVYSESPVDGLFVSREGNGAGRDVLFQSPGRILALLNRHLYRSTQPEKYATLFLAHYDAASAKLTYSNAGQLPPLVLGQNGNIRRLDKGGTVVGLMDGMHYEEDSFHMQPGEILVAYSDGVTEPENDFGEFGEERLMEVVARYRDQPLHVISNQVMLALDAWIGAEEQPDDITLVLARQP
jgi:phosphoserine phosphatase RsbU/P